MASNAWRLLSTRVVMYRCCHGGEGEQLALIKKARSKLSGDHMGSATFLKWLAFAVAAQCVVCIARPRL